MSDTGAARTSLHHGDRPGARAASRTRLRPLEPETNIITDLRKKADWALNQAERHLEREGVVVSSSLLYGRVSTCIQAAIEPHDLFEMTTPGTGRAAASKLGSVAARMVEHVTTPLVIGRVKPLRDVVMAAACPWIKPVSSASAFRGTW